MNGGHGRFLASVTTPAEAAIVLEGGADIVDIKNPVAGVLGAAEPARVAAIVRAVAAAAPTSATIGDITLDAAAIERGIVTMSGCGVDIVKVGWFGPQSAPAVTAVLAAAAQRGIRLVVVLFAEYGIQLDRVVELAAAGVYGVMLDTADKQSGGLRTKLTPEQLVAFNQRLKHYNLICGLAGSLRPTDIPALLDLQPDYLGFRGAFCRAGDRAAAVDPELVHSIRSYFDMHARARVRAS